MKKINILGTEYTIENKHREEDEALSKCSGYCDMYARKIVIIHINDIKKDPDCTGNAEAFLKKVLRHEVTHAFFYESGMTEESENEKLVDWIAVQLPKIASAINTIKVGDNYNASDEM